jgi:5'-phosphate synthase pdxT subunit
MAGQSGCIEAIVYLPGVEARGVELLIARQEVVVTARKLHPVRQNWIAERNAFGRQVASFETDLDVEGLDTPFHAVFIRAPWIAEAGAGVDILAEVDGHPVLAREGRILVASFHPELTDDTRIHETFLELVREEQGVRA